MKLKDIKKGQTYIKVNVRPAETIKYYVLEVKEKKVFASAGGAPPSWVDKQNYKHWQS